MDDGTQAEGQFEKRPMTEADVAASAFGNAKSTRAFRGAMAMGFVDPPSISPEEADVEIGVFTKAVNDTRKTIKEIAKVTKQLDDGINATMDAFIVRDREVGEVLENILLAYRHLEDASMRLGKAIQAADGGVSVYDKASTVGA